MANSLIPTSLKEVADSFKIQFVEDELRNRGNRPLKTKIFFDTFNVISMIQGLRALINVGYSSLEFNEKYFKNDMSVLVHAFAQKGWLGEGSIYMLPPHEDELAGKIFDKNGLLFPRYKIDGFDSFVEEFKRGIGFEELEKNIYSAEDLEAYIESLTDGASLIFKTTTITNPIFWADRFKSMVAGDNIKLKLENEDYDLPAIVNTETYKRIKKALDQCRRNENLRQSNYIDAVALYILHKKLVKFKKSNFKEVLPVYYVSKAGIRNAIDVLNKEDPRLFSYEHDDHWIPVVRDSMYFIVDMVFNLKNTEESVQQAFDEISLFEKMKDTIKERYHLFVPKDFGKEALDFEDEREQHIYDLISTEFVKQIWIGKGAYSDVKNIVKNLHDFKDDPFPKEKVSSAIEKRIKSIHEGLDKSSEKSNFMRQTWKELNALYKGELEDKFSVRGFVNVDVSFDYALLRFSFDEETTKKIQRAIEDLFSSYKVREDDYVNCILMIKSRMFNGVYGKEGKKKTADLLMSIGVLWVLEKFDLIIKMCDQFYDGKENNYPSYQIPLIHAASYCKEKRANNPKVKGILNCLKRKYSGKENYKLWLGMSYINFNVWLSVNDFPSIPEWMPEQERDRAFKNHREEFDESLGCLKKVITYLRDNREGGNTIERNKKYVYALNNYIYYVTKGGSADLFLSQNTKDRVTIFLQMEGEAPWQKRFYDTLGWYNARMALLTKGDNSEYLQRALRYNEQSKEAVIRVKMDEVVYNKLTNILTDSRIKRR